MSNIHSYLDIDENELYDLYVNQKYTQKQCAEKLGVNEWNVRLALEKYNIPKRSRREIRSSKLVIQMTTIMYETLRGALLGDGSLLIPQNGVNAIFRYSSKSRQHVEYITKDFIRYSTGNGLIENDRYDKRTDKYYHQIVFSSRSSETFTDEYYKWYINKEKHIPCDLILTPHTCLCWYIGDGCLRTKNNGSTQELLLCTNCFLKNEIETILLPQLSQFDAKLYYTNTSKNGKRDYAIGICKKHNIKKFLDYIGQCPFEDYKYKWDIKPQLFNGMLAKYNQYANEWILAYQNGQSTFDIACKYNCKENVVIKALQNHWII